jgi:hypothetical protein
MNQAAPKGLNVREGRTYLDVSHKNGILSFVSPVFGPGNYFNVQKSIESAELKAPTMAETVSLVYSAFNSQDRHSEEIKKIMEGRYFLAFTGNLYVPSKGVYIQDNPALNNGKLIMEEGDLVKKLESNDSSVRYVPFGFNTGEQTSRELERNSYITALAGEEGAEKLAEIADFYKEKPYVFSFNSVNKLTSRISALFAYWYGHRLSVCGVGHVGGRGGGYAFGVFGK